MQVTNGQCAFSSVGLSSNGHRLIPGDLLKTLTAQSFARGSPYSTPKLGLIENLVAYGIPYTKSTKVEDLREKLISAAKNGQCDVFLPAIQTVHDELKRDYDVAVLEKQREDERLRKEAKERDARMFQEYMEMQEKRRQEQKEREQREFEELVRTDPAQAASRDPEQFVRCAYLDDDGGLDKTKTTEPVIVQYASWWGSELLQKYVADVEGLHFVEDSTDRTVIVGLGWDEDAVHEAVEDAVEEIAAIYHAGLFL